MNILSLIQNQLSAQTIGQISNAVGEGQEQTKSALSTAFPALLGSLVGKANASPSGLGEIFNTIKQGQLQGGWTDSVGNARGVAEYLAPGGDSRSAGVAGRQVAEGRV